MWHLLPIQYKPSNENDNDVTVIICDMLIFDSYYTTLIF